MREGWTSKPLVELSELFTDGDWVETKDQAPSGIRLVQTGNVGIGEFKSRRDKARFISASTFDRLKCTEVVEGDCLISRLPDPVGRSCILPDTGERMITAVDCTIVRFRGEVLLPTFFRYYSQTSTYLADVDRECTGATRRRISRKNLGKVEVPLPPLPEQERIVTMLDEAFEAIATATANTEKNLANARELFEACRDAKLQAHSRGWSESPLSELVTFKHGFAFKSEYFVDDGEYVCLTPGNFFERGGYRDRGDKQKRYRGPIPDGFLLKSGDMLVAMTEQAAGLLGSPLIVPASGIFLHNQRLGLVEPRQDVPWCNEYFAHVFNTRKFRDEVHRHASGVKVRHTSPTKLSAIRVRYPDSTEGQAAIANALDALEESVRRLRVGYVNRVDHLANLKQSILEKAFCGELTAVDRELSDAGV